MKKFIKLLSLFSAFFKIGLFTFGGGYAMISIIERELVEKKKWIEQNEFLDIIAVAESTPGPIAINSATFIGYRVGKFFGSVFATLGVIIPSFLIIFIISFFFDKFLSLEYVSYAFKGIRACVGFIILSAGVKMFLKTKKNPFSWILFGLTVLVFVAFTFFSVPFSAIFFILIGGVIGITAYLIGIAVNKTKEKNPEKVKDGKTVCFDENDKGGNR